MSENKIGEAEALNNLGELMLTLSAYDEARICHGEAITIARNLASLPEEARALEGIGQCYLRTGHESSALGLMRQASAIYHSIGFPEAQRSDEILQKRGF